MLPQQVINLRKETLRATHENRELFTTEQIRRNDIFLVLLSTYEKLTDNELKSINIDGVKDPLLHDVQKEVVDFLLKKEEQE